MSDEENSAVCDPHNEAGQSSTINRSTPVTPQEPPQKRQRTLNEHNDDDVSATTRDSDFVEEVDKEPSESRKMFDCIQLIIGNSRISECSTGIGCRTRPSNKYPRPYYVKFPRDFTTKVILKLQEIVNEKIRLEMVNAEKGAIIYHHHRYNCNGEPKFYIGVVASYNGTDGKPVQSMLACGDIPKDKYSNDETSSHGDDPENVEPEDNDDDEAKIEFYSLCSANHIKDTVFRDRFGLYEKAFTKWAVCTIGRGTDGVNQRVANKLGLPFVACHKDLFHQEINQMLRQTKDTPGGAGRVISHAHELTKMALQSKYFRNDTDLFVSERTIFEGDWYFDASILWRFGTRKDAILQAVQCSNGKESTCFQELIKDNSSVDKIDQVLRNLDCLSDALRDKKLPLNLCRNYLKIFLDHIAANKENVKSIWFDHQVGDTFINPSSSFLENLDFIRGVCKIQSKDFMLLCPQEKYACENLKNEELPPSSTDEKHNLAKLLQETRRKTLAIAEDSDVLSNDRHGGYHDCSFITGSLCNVVAATDMAHDLWDFRKQDFNGRYDLYEAVTMLDFNRRLWDEETVAEAINTSSISSSGAKSCSTNLLFDIL